MGYKAVYRKIEFTGEFNDWNKLERIVKTEDPITENETSKEISNEDLANVLDVAVKECDKVSKEHIDYCDAIVNYTLSNVTTISKSRDKLQALLDRLKPKP